MEVSGTLKIVSNDYNLVCLIFIETLFMCLHLIDIGRNLGPVVTPQNCHTNLNFVQTNSKFWKSKFIKMWCHFDVGFP